MLTARGASGVVSSSQNQWRGQAQPAWDKTVTLERWWLAPWNGDDCLTAVCGSVAGSSRVVKVRVQPCACAPYGVTGFLSNFLLGLRKAALQLISLYAACQPCGGVWSGASACFSHAEN
jgi:hypothetical protein